MKRHVMERCPDCGLGYGTFGCRCPVTINDPRYHEIKEEEKRVARAPDKSTTGVVGKAGGSHFGGWRPSGGV